MREVLVHHAVAKTLAQHPRFDVGVGATLQAFHRVNPPPAFQPPRQLEYRPLRVGLGVHQRDDSEESELLQRSQQLEQLAVALVATHTQQHDAELGDLSLGGVLCDEPRCDMELFAREVP
ncbi:hypothetical protein ACRS6B_14120 [Nocardia asteroides]